MSARPEFLETPALSRRRVAIGGGLLFAAMLSGCVVAPVGRYGGYGAYDGYVGQPGEGYDSGPVPVPPPAPQYEVIGVAPFPGWLWINGYWGWRANRHVWIGGQWQAPRPGYHWQPHRWERSDRGWRQSPGGWSRR